jgi:CBS domain-containing protein
MKVRECMAHEVFVVDAEHSIREAAERMRCGRVGCLPVVSAGVLAGLITDRDLVIRALAAGLPLTTPVRQVMTHQAVTCLADEPLEQAVELMVRSSVRRLVVLDRELQICGILSVDDLSLVDPDERLATLVLAATVEQRG